jgi:hypothetical protein
LWEFLWHAWSAFAGSTDLALLPGLSTTLDAARFINTMVLGIKNDAPYFFLLLSDIDFLICTWIFILRYDDVPHIW